MPAQYTFGITIIRFVNFVISVYSIVIFLRAIFSWFSLSPYNQFYLLLIRITEPVLSPIRRIIPFSGIDFSPMIAILLIEFIVKRVLIGLMHALFF